MKNDYIDLTKLQSTGVKTNIQCPKLFFLFDLPYPIYFFIFLTTLIFLPNCILFNATISVESRNLKSKTLYIFFILFLISFLVLISCDGNSNKQIPVAKDGILDLADVNFDQNGIIELNGEWEFYWHALYSPKDIPQVNLANSADKSADVARHPEVTYISAPTLWREQAKTDETISDTGYATYRLKLINTPDNLYFALDLLSETFLSACEIFVNNDKVYSSGTVSRFAEDEIPTYSPRIVPVRLKKGENEIIVRTSNHHFRSGGFFTPLELGLTESLIRKKSLMRIFDLFLFGSVLIMAFYHFGVGLLQKRFIASLFLAVSCLLFAVRISVTNSQFLSDIFPNLLWEIDNKIEYATLMLIPLFFLTFIQKLFPDDFPRGILPTIQIVNSLFTLLVMATGTFVYTNLLTIFYVVIGIEALIALYVGFKAAMNKRDGAILFLTGIFCIVVITEINILFYQTVFYSDLTSTGLFIFLLFQSMILASRYSKAFKQVEEMSANLKVYSDELSSINTELANVDRLKDEFLATTSHELKMPLNGIVSIAETLLNGATGDLRTNTKKNLQLIVASGIRLSNLVNDILDLSKIRNNRLDIRLRPLDIYPIVKNVLLTSKILIENKPIKLINNVGKNTPPIYADENRLGQVLSNLLDNAIKFTESGRIVVSAYTKKSYLIISVRDTGVGIPAEKRNQIFDYNESAVNPLSSGDTAMGIGLPITKRLVELMKGRIFVASTVGKGSRFSFILRLSKKKPVNEGIGQSAGDNALVQEHFTETSDASEISVEGSEDTILVVDDEAISLQVISNHLSESKYKVVKRTNGDEAIEAIENGLKPSLVLLDAMMPKMSGFEACQILRETYSMYQLPIILMTSAMRQKDVAEAFKQGANDFITKPVAKSVLLSRINTHLQLSKISQAYSYYVPFEFLELLEKKDILEVGWGDHINRTMTIMFTDIRSYTTLSEMMTSGENFNFINDYLCRVGPVIREHNGFINQFYGDGLMCLFGKSADDAIDAAIGMLKAVEEFNVERVSNWDLPIKIGIGLNTGELMLGIIGDKDRMDTNVISDSVNLSARMEGLTKIYGASITLTGETLNALSDASKYKTRYLDKVMVKGKTKAVSIYEILDGEPEDVLKVKMSTKGKFEEGISQYLAGHFESAKDCFEAVLKTNPEDKTASIYIERANYYIEFGKPPDWTGVEMLDKK